MTKSVRARKVQARKKGKVLQVELYLPEGAVEVNGVPCQQNPPLTVEQVKAILGWQEEPEGGKWKDYKLIDVYGNKVKLAGVKANRPFRIGLAKRYANEFVRGKWRFNGESFVIDSNGQFQDGQHRGVGFVLADQMREKDPGKWKEYLGAAGKSGLTLDALIVRGVPPNDDVVDTLNTGQKRTLGDVIYRNHTIANARKGAYTDKELVVLSNILAGALRLVWMRVVNKAVNDAPHFPHSEAMDFLKAHSDLTKAVLQVWDYEDGSEKRISKSMTVAYAGGLFYLMACSKTDPEQFMEQGVHVLDLSNWDKAKEFWDIFASGRGGAGSPMLRAKDIVKTIEAGSAMGREEIIRTVVKAWNLWTEGKKSVARDTVVVSKAMNEEKEMMVLAEAPRIGGIDTDWSMYELELVVDDDESPNETVIDPETGDEIIRRKQKPKKGGKGKKGRQSHESGWKVGDTVWVIDPEGPWFGTIETIHDDNVDIVANDDGTLYNAAIRDLAAEKPADADSLEEDDLPSVEEDDGGEYEEDEDDLGLENDIEQEIEEYEDEEEDEV